MKYLAILVALVGVAHADNKATKAITNALSAALAPFNDDMLPPITLVDNDTKFKEEYIYGDGSPTNDLFHVVVGLAADGHTGWISADSTSIFVCGMEGCDKLAREQDRKEHASPPYHHTALVEDGKLLFLHFGTTGKGVGHDDMEADIPDDAKPVVEQFQKTIGDPKAFAATISARKDVVLFGTEANERFVGGATARATLLKWKLSLTVHAGIRAGMTKSKTVAWIAADVDARSPKAKEPSPYRLTVVYEKTGNDWKIVQLHFS